MKEEAKGILEGYERRHKFLRELHFDICGAVEEIICCYKNNGKLLVCGNGGSNSDADHIVGEMVKGFVKKRELDREMKERLEYYGNKGIAEKLQGSLPAINLGAHASLVTALVNDIGGDMIFAQQVMGYGNEKDILIGITTSGNSKDVINAGAAAKAKGMKTILLTGGTGGEAAGLFERRIIAPDNAAAGVQDMHSAIYHVICMMVESEFWDD